MVIPVCVLLVLLERIVRPRPQFAPLMFEYVPTGPPSSETQVRLEEPWRDLLMSVFTLISILLSHIDNNCEFFLCPTNIDDCDPNPCLNGGTCTNGANNYTCTCAAGFEANNCETKVDDCDPNPCLNGGTCRDGVNSYTIFCLSNCEINIDICNPNPCLKDGTCTVGVNGFSCRCLPGFSGDTCEKNIDDCIPNPCLNGGTCEDGINNYTCTCAEEYEGTNCENKYPRKILGGSKPINL
jgi:hypothetical protein